MDSEKLEAHGGEAGGLFDDGVFEGVKKIVVGKDPSCISYIKIEYVKDGKFETREHGTILGALEEFAVDYPNEYITSVGGSYDHVPSYKEVLITSLIFKTSNGRTSLIGKTSGTEFMFQGKKGGKLIGFHGRSGQALDAIGAYFDFGGAQKLEAQGGETGGPFDDGIFDGVVRINVVYDSTCIDEIKITYQKDGKPETYEHGENRWGAAGIGFSVDYPNEYITSVGGSYKYVPKFDSVIITSLIFKSSSGRGSMLFGNNRGSTEFMLQGKNGGKLLGFHGRSGQVLDAIGAYFDSGEAQKLEAEGGEAGNQGSN